LDLDLGLLNKKSNKMKLTILIISLLTISSCTSIQLAVPEQFSSQATKMHVKGVNGWQIGQRLSFGKYNTSKVKRGCNITSTRQDRNSGITTEERILKVFNIQKENTTSNQRTKYQYTLQDGNLAAEVFCLEKMTKEELVVRSNIRWLGDTYQTKNYQYSFSAAILPMTREDDEPWQLVLYNNYDRSKDTARRLLDLPYVEEEGWVSNGKETITIRPIRVRNVTTKKGREAQMPVKMLSGYELRIEDGVVAIIDTFDHNIWIYNELDAPTKLVIASIGSALMLRKIQDVNG
jgi:hypothetical protein